MYLNPFAISGLLIGFTCTGLLLIIFSNIRKDLHYLYSLNILSIAIWGYGSFLIGISTSPAISMILWKIAYSSVILIPVFFLHVILILCNKSRNWLLCFAYSQAIILIFSNIIGRVFWQVKFMFNSFYYLQMTWIGFISFLIWASLVVYAHYELLKFYIITEKDSRIRIFYFFLAAVVGFGGGVTNFLPSFNINFYPYGNFGIPFYCIIIAFAILKYQLMDINIVIRKGLVYSILITIFTIIYLSVVIITEKLFQGILGYRSALFSIISASIIVIIFTPLRNKIQLFIDKIFLGKTPEQIAQENELLRQELMHSEKLKTVATFASGMAHEIKNPLTVIKTFTEYLPQNIGNKEFLQEFPEVIGPEVEKINDLVHQLLDFSKPAPLQFKEIDIYKLIDDTIDILSSQLIKYGINVSKDYKFGINGPMVKIDPQKMTQVFMNLFINAIEAMPKGGELFIETNQQNNELHISVQDTGYGIPEKDMPHIFEPFYSTKEKGSGLGLSIIYNIIKEHKGKVSVYSKVNRGSKFKIELPIANF